MPHYFSSIVTKYDLIGRRLSSLISGRMRTGDGTSWAPRICHTNRRSNFRFVIHGHRGHGYTDWAEKCSSRALSISGRFLLERPHGGSSATVKNELGMRCPVISAAR